MRKLYLVIICILISSMSYSQKQPEEFLGRIPSLPDGTCSMKRVEKENYLNELSKLHEELKDEIDRRRQTVEDNYAGSEEQMKQNMAKEYGLSQSDMQKLEKDEMSEEEKQAMINKMVQQKTNLSMEELKKLKNMSKEGQKAWAEAYSTEQMANAQADPEAAQKEQSKNKERYELAKEQSQILQRLKALGEKYFHKIQELDKIDSVASIELEQKRKPLMEKIGSVGDETDIVEAVRAIERDYCGKLTPKYLDIIAERYSDLKKSLPDFYRLEEVNAKLNQITTGIKKDLSSPGLLALEAVDEYVTLLQSCFKYANYTFPDDYVIIQTGD